MLFSSGGCRPFASPVTILSVHARFRKSFARKYRIAKPTVQRPSRALRRFAGSNFGLGSPGPLVYLLAPLHTSIRRLCFVLPLAIAPVRLKNNYTSSLPRETREALRKIRFAARRAIQRKVRASRAGEDLGPANRRVSLETRNRSTKTPAHPLAACNTYDWLDVFAKIYIFFNFFYTSFYFFKYFFYTFMYMQRLFHRWFLFQQTGHPFRQLSDRLF